MFNHTLVISVFTLHDAEDTAYHFLSVVCCGTKFHLVALASTGPGIPGSAKCYRKFVQMWTSWAGWPQIVVTDRGTHNQGQFSKGLSAHGVYLKQAALEAPEQIGTGERHGGLFKRVMKRVIKQNAIVGKERMKLAAAEVQNSKNEFVKIGGFSPHQWVLGKAPRGVGLMLDDEELGHLGTLENQLDPGLEFGLKSEYRTTARKAFVKEDCSRRVAAATLRKSAPLPGNYQAGDFVCFRREQSKSKAPGYEWSPVSRTLGFDGKGV